MKYGEDGAPPHAVTSVAPEKDPSSIDNQSIAYTSFNKIQTIEEGAYKYEVVYGPNRQRKKTLLKKNGSVQKTKYYITKGYEKEVYADGLVRELHYMKGAVYVKRNDDKDSLYYVYSDYLGSPQVITDEEGNIKERLSFDAWGQRRNPDDWSYNNVPTSHIFDRGFTGLQHLDRFGLINMNGRVYDPKLGRFLSPDPVIQSPDNPQNYNRYSYVLNNPLKYKDPDGEFFIGTILTFAGDLLKTAFIDGGLDPISSNARQNAWRDFDPTAPWSATNKAWKIDIGGFKTDPNRTIVGRGIQLLSRWTWEIPQTVLGKAASHSRNWLGQVDNVDYYGGATLVNDDDPSAGVRWGFTLGPYINSKNIVADPNVSDIFRHEYGHTLQSRLVGPLYLTHVALPSLIGSGLEDMGINDHNREWYETQANRMAFRYFNNHDSGALTALPWNDNEYPREYNPNWYWMFAHPPLPFMWWLFF